MKAEIWQVITERLIIALEAGVIPWRKPWSEGRELPANLASGRPYTNWINLMLLSLSDFASPFWLTRGQALKLGGDIRDGARPTTIFPMWWRWIESDRRPGTLVPIFKHRTVPVFNYEQCRGLKKTPRPPVKGTFVHDPVAAAEALVAAMPDPPSIVEDGAGYFEAFYNPPRDTVVIPRPARFERRVDYYAVLFHELAHSTGHQRRLNRPFSRRRDEDFGREELTAEMAAAFLCGQAGILDQTINSNAGYLEAWLRHLDRRGDYRPLITAAAQAQKAAAYILGRLPSLALAA
jgi:antirestriction protein ArdC